MKKFITTIFLFIAFVSTTFAELDTLTYWARGTGIGTYDNSAIQMQWAHFYPEAPCEIKGVIVYFYGNAGTANIYIAGQEAGSSIPEVVDATNKVLWGINNQQFNAQPTTATPTLININPSISITGNQFFVGFTGISSGMFLGTDQVQQNPVCESSNGGTYLYQAYYTNDGQTAGWQLGGYAYLIDVIVDYPTKTPAMHLRDVTEDYSIPTDLSRATIASADYNDDGYVDLLIDGKLFKNVAGNNFEDITSSSGLSGKPTANAFIDMDNDGNMDILFLMQGAGSKSKIFINDGEGNFTGTNLSIPELSSVTCFSIADINNDKYPDIFIGQLWEVYPEPKPNFFLYNNLSNDFTDNTTVIYPEHDGEWNFPNADWDPDNYVVDRNRNSRGSQWVDFDNDGDLDLFVTNYFLQWDEFYRNNGDGSFTNIISEKNIDVNNSGNNHGTGVDWMDFDNDGDMDLLLSQFAHPRFIKTFDHRPLTIYKNSGSPSFNFADTYDSENFQSTIGLGYEETYAGAAWGDVNNDGLADFIATTYYGCRYIDFYMQKSDNTFENKTFEFGLEGIVTGEDACWIDFDNDGKLDLAMSEDRKFRLFQNYYDLNYDWVEVILEGSEGQKYNIIGARVKVYLEDKEFMQEVSCGRGQKIQKPYRLHFGLGRKANISKIEVRWPGDTEFEEFIRIKKNQIVKLIQGRGGEQEVPEIPVLISPNDESIDVNVKMEKLKWDEVYDAEKYQLQLSTDVDFSAIIIDKDNITETEFAINELESVTSYYWKVRAGNPAGFGEWSESWMFTTAVITSNTPPAPVLVAPENEAIEVSIKSDNFIWKASENAIEYNLQASKSENFEPLDYEFSGLDVTTFPISELDKNTSYYWRVRGWNDDGFGDWSQIWLLTTDDSRPDYPEEPALIYPENSAEDIKPNEFVSWASGKGATKYHLQIANDFPISSNLVLDINNLYATKYPVKDLESKTTYYWQVYSINSRAESEMSSDTRNFTTGEGFITDVVDLNSAANKIFLSDSRPNPITSSASFEFGITKSSKVNLQIFNLKGEEVASLISKEMMPGTYQATWFPNDLESGVFYAKLTSGKTFITKQLIIMK